jgi:predicted nucleic acid-binding protein
MSLIVDASVAVKWLVDEPGSDNALSLYAGEDDVAAPTLILAEVGNALWKKYRKTLVTGQQLKLALDSLPRFFDRLCELPELAPRAGELALRLDQPIHDCFYLALAERENTALVTADERQFAVARKARIKARLL